MSINRRNFIKKSAAISAGIGSLTILPSSVWSAKAAPSDKVNVALIGCRNMGFGILKHHLSFDDVNCVAMCDVDHKLMMERAKTIKDDFGFAPKLYSDYRKMLQQNDIDAVIIGTPDHWHCLQMVDAVKAGKDVYVEKPMANSIEECNIMVKASNYYNKVVQVGQQQRSNPFFIKSMEMIKSGAIGNLRKVNIWANFNYGLGANPTNDSTEPEGVDYNMWLGPAAKRPFNQARFHGSWRHFWDYGGGLMSDWGVHLVDMGLWALDKTDGPNKVMTFAANNSGRSKMRETFDTMNMVFPTKNCVINYDLTAGVQVGQYDNPYGVAFVGDLGTLIVDRHHFKLKPEWDNNKKVNMIEAIDINEGAGESHQLHVRNFIDCVKSRDIPACPPEIGRATALHVHAANIGARVGESYLEWNEKDNHFNNSEKANDFIIPNYRDPWKLPKILN